MSENSDALKRGYEAFNSGDVEALGEIYEDDVRWEGPNTEGVPMSGVYEGKDAVLQALGRIPEDFEQFRVSPDELVEQGDTIVVLSTSKAARNPETTSSSPVSRSGACRAARRSACRAWSTPPR